jgi:hypothetical protein
MLAKLLRQVQRLTGYLLALIAMMGQLGAILVCIFVILRGPTLVVEFLAGINRINI